MHHQVPCLCVSSRHFATHIGPLADRLGAVRLSADDAEHVTAAVHQVFDAAGLAAGLTIGLQRHTPQDQWAHYTLLTDPEWALLAGGANERNTFYECALRPRHVGPHVAHVQLVSTPHQPDQNIWIRWNSHIREMVPQLYCTAEHPSEDPAGIDDPLMCMLFDGHAGQHDFS
ncbi:hypothetical protein AB0C27_28500 [Nonomuraea sp. NPDC048882]|uniref:hypothetical protein n=1 Tax=Nonomuraea sp. NPDC048882 TaxID=3154347 RepID=UPI0033EFE12D